MCHGVCPVALTNRDLPCVGQKYVFGAVGNGAGGVTPFR
jgi:hypothetical protein